MKTLFRLAGSVVWLSLCACTAYTTRVCTPNNQVDFIGSNPQTYDGNKAPGLETWKFSPAGKANAVGRYTAKDGFSIEFTVRTCRVLTSTFAEISQQHLFGKYMLFELVPRGPHSDPFSTFDVEQLTAIESSLWQDEARHRSQIELRVPGARFPTLIDVVDNKGLTPEEFVGKLTWYRLFAAKMSDSGTHQPDPPILRLTRE